MQSTISSETDVRQKVEETASTVVDQAQQVANTQQEKVAEALEGVAQTLRESGSNMREQQPQVASLTEQAASRIDDAAIYLREHTITDLIDQAESFARREPVLFLGAAFAAGFIAARFLKASNPNRFDGQRYEYRSLDTGYRASLTAQRSNSGRGPEADEFSRSKQSGGSQEGGSPNYAGSDTTYHSAAVDYDMSGDTGVRGVGADLEPDAETDPAEGQGSADDDR
jgi:hypothetical protein